MGSTELALLLKFGIPLAIKLLAGGKDEVETVEAINNLITGIANDSVDVGDALLLANQEQTSGIIQGIYDVITGATNALSNLVKAFSNLFKA